jgi:hypothetical protein
MSVIKAVEKASAKSKRKGKWASKPEISAKITGKRPENLGGELARLVKKEAIEKKKGNELWRPTESLLGGMMGASMSAGIRTGVESGIRGGVQSSVTHLLM